MNMFNRLRVRSQGKKEKVFGCCVKVTLESWMHFPFIYKIHNLNQTSSSSSFSVEIRNAHTHLFWEENPNEDEDEDKFSLFRVSPRPTHAE